ncbi:cAMP-dependent protein kinase catalytic subunit PRKX [Malaya genurostris]|uniref:cAMP-dependent protein kinase catalytic subunit PRKX n=1 Tax=Malaya genurostris TaxID=325434 RepID=UPI0026F384A7|nr:cAMP-dependent protein kinase catalytic subunit PRKX [Malaya genurostris]XP_058458369.1 cAMP-dependent protein kinase catalytic subunit PRKX [Malaya genurostris]XP_058458370.1 cAMP-dependent protein kinase catalytic subunit PRKX [Malaya genurostris]XP_058458371.1 cAMP-dependent protein kinase catalytic subunit PRKX [Malaya genurostris]XP_058458372.1 cAMP-dependent protein kinase catalytic subunit PRKX [Malaya genurostris]
MSSSPMLTSYTLRIRSDTSPVTATATISSGTGNCTGMLKKLNLNDNSSASTNSGEYTDPLESDFSGEEEEEEEEEEDEEVEVNDEKGRFRVIKPEEDEEEEEEGEDDDDDNDEIELDDGDENEDREDATKASRRRRGQTKDCRTKNGRHRNASSDDDAHDSGDSDDESDDASDKNNNIGGIRCKQPREYDLDDFQILKTIGTGTFGRVCLCRDRHTDKYWAMKILAMADVIRLKQIEHVKNEKNILQEIDHPFIVNMRWHNKDDCCLYMLFEYVSGGELFSYLRNAGRFDNTTANFYACEIVLALEYLHTLSVVYRDLKPENLLLDRDGHLKITDFGFAKKLKDRTWTLCGTPEYLAPEIIQSKGHNKAVDWWALGILIHEMLVGYPPFYDDNPFGIYEKILSGKIEWSRHIEPVAKDLIKKLLVQDRTKRLGNMKNGAEDVKRHRWFKHLDWDVVIKRQLKPPIVPKFVNEGDTGNFDDYPETDWKSARSLDKLEMQLFEDF